MATFALDATAARPAVSVPVSIAADALPALAQLSVYRGTLFGTDPKGGAGGFGDVFEVRPAVGGVQEVAYCTGESANDLRGPVVFDAAGDAFGAAFLGGVTPAPSDVPVYGQPDGGPFEVTAAAVAAASAPRLVFTTMPTSAQAAYHVDPATGRTFASAPLGTIGVTVEDAAGRTVHSADGDMVTLSKAVGFAGAVTLSGTTATVANGVATFTGVTIRYGFDDGLVDVGGSYNLAVADADGNAADGGGDQPSVSSYFTIAAPSADDPATPDYPGAVEATVYNDVNGNGQLDPFNPRAGSFESNLSGQTVYLDVNDNGQLDAGDLSSTGAGDVLTIPSVPPGTYPLRLVVPAGYRLTDPAGQLTVTVPPGGSAGQFHFGVVATGEPTPMGLSTAVTRSTVPTAAVAGAPVRGSVRVTLTNDTAERFDSRSSTVRVYATTTGTVDADSRLIGTARHRIRLAAGRAMTLAVAVRSAGLLAGDYAMLVQTTAADGTVATSAAGPALAVSPAVASLSATVGPATLSAGRPAVVAVTVTNAGNVPVAGPISIRLGLTTDGTTVAIPLATTVRRGTLRPGRAATVRLRFRAPAASAGTYRSLVTFVRDGVPLGTSVGPAAVTVG